MKCPTCPSEMEVGEACPQCGWEPIDMLEEALANIERIKSGQMTGGPTASDLFAGEHLRKPDRLRGVGRGQPSPVLSESAT